ncbi:MAG: hypothetical protein Fur002_22640 [Anaerolineales bacterium]
MSLLKPSVKTPFHIDFTWWKQNESDWRVFLTSLLCLEHRELFANFEDDQIIDWVDPVTAEVKPVDAIQHTLITHCAFTPEFTENKTAVVEAVFRIFLANGNIPMSSEELSKKLGRPADTILRTLSGARIYRGLRPYQAAAATTAEQSA